MSAYFNYLLMKHNGNISGAMHEFIGKENTVSVPKGKSHINCVKVDDGTVLNKKLVEKYSNEYFLANTKLSRNEYPKLYHIYDCYLVNKTVFVENIYNRDQRRQYRVEGLIKDLKSGRCKLSIDSLTWLVRQGFLEN